MTIVQSFTRLAAETRRFGDIAQEVIRNQFPVLNWWALVNVLTRGASTLPVISIVVIGTLAAHNGQATVGEIVSFMGFSTLLIGRLELPAQFIASLFFRMPALEQYFGVLDARSTVPELPRARDLGAPRGEVGSTASPSPIPAVPHVLNDVSFTADPGMSVALVGHTGAGKSTRWRCCTAVDPTRRPDPDRRPEPAPRDAG